MVDTGGSRLRRAGERLMPPGSRTRAISRFGLQMLRHGREVAPELRDDLVETSIRLGVPYSYSRWLAGHIATPAELRRQRDLAAETFNSVRFLCVIDGPEGLTGPTLASLDGQTWPRWRRGGIDDAASDEWVIVMSAGDRLEPDALFRVADAVWSDPFLRLIGWDDDVSVHRDKTSDPRFRPCFSPETLLAANYLGRSFAVRADAISGAGGLDGLGPVALWDLLLRLDLNPERVERIPRVLGHLESRQPDVPPGSEHVVQAHLDRLGWPARASWTASTIRLDWSLAEWPTVSLVIPSRFNTPLLARLLPTLATTDYPEFDVTIIDNSGRSDDKDAWYRRAAGSLDLCVRWWTGDPFNYSVVNNTAAAETTGEVLLFLNDDTEVLDPGWMRDLVGWATRPGVGTVGAQLVGADGMIQHGGVMMGLNGLAEHLFSGMAPHSESIIGSTDWTRNLSAVTGACVAIRREIFDDVAGFDERFVLTGSDVALCLDVGLAGYRTVCSTGARVRHLESATRGDSVLSDDVFTSWWRYQRWITGGDPFVSPNLSAVAHEPRVAWPTDPTSLELLGRHMGRSFGAFRQSTTESENLALADRCRADESTRAAVDALHMSNPGEMAVESVSWFIPDFDSPFYGGINTILRIADHLRAHHGVTNEFVVIASPQEAWIRSAIRAAFPDLGDSAIKFVDGSTESVANLSETDVGIATIWHSAFTVAHARGPRRKVYLIQDYEPAFYPAGTLAALAEESYHLGLLGLCNSPTLGEIYRGRFGGTAMSFTPAVDGEIFHANGRPERAPDDPVTVFLYARPGHWRNCWEIASLALGRVKDRFGDGVRIVTAGSWARPEDLGSGIEHLGLVEYSATGDLYRRADVGIALTTSAHPSYLPLELTACGVPVVAFEQPGFSWALRDGENCLLAHRTVDSVAAAVEQLVDDVELRLRLASGGLSHVRQNHSSWVDALAGVYPFLCDPRETVDRG